ncbi:MAG: ureidoglycolate lyase [Myxococcaceae bacterium]
MKTIEAVPLHPEAFAPFGDVVSAGLRSGSSANQGTAVRFDWSAALMNSRSNAKANLAVFRSAPQPLPFTVKLLERHPHSTQAFLPMIAQRFLVIVAPTASNGEPDVAQLRAFVCGPGQGINYKPACWHHPIIALDVPAEFAMLAWEDGTAADCEERPLAEQVQIVGPGPLNL